MPDKNGKYSIRRIHYRDIYGNLLWEAPMQFKSLWDVGGFLVNDGITYTIKRVAVADDIQHVNIEAGDSNDH